MRLSSGITILTLIVFLISCDKEPVIEINNPDTYAFNRNGTSTVSFSGQTTRILMATELVDGMEDFNQTETRLIEMYTNQTADGQDANPFNDSALNASTKSVKSKVAASTDFFAANTAGAAIIKADIQTWIENQFSEVFPNSNELASAGSAGQIADGSTARYINAKGLEYKQAVNKSLIGALMVDQICNHYLSSSILDEGENVNNNDQGLTEPDEAYTTMEHKWDEAYGYLFGGVSNGVEPLTTLGEDNFLNKYLSRVEDDPDFAGIANDIWQAYKLGRAAIVAGDYTVRDEQAAIVKEKISEVIAIRSIYYLQNGKTKLVNNDLGGAFHDLSEGFGFVYSLQFLPANNSSDPLFPSSEVNAFIDQLTAGNGFWDLDGNTLDQMSETIASKFDFTVAQAAE